jgi:BioD-like phosphotransacetylase family protein
MLALYVCSPAPGAGKTAICVGLARRLAADGLAVAYQKPVGRSVDGPGAGPAADPDAAFVRQALRLRPPLEAIAPVSLSHAPLAAHEARARVRAAFERTAQGRDVLVLESAPDRQAGAELGLSAPEVLDLLGARALIVVPYAPEGLVESVVELDRVLGGRAIGAVVNLVPELARRHVERRVRSALVEAGIPLLGAVPVEPKLMGVTVGELATALGGTFLCAEGEAGRPVEAYMISAMSDLGADAYFQRHVRKAVVASGDHPDVHLPALQTDTSCIVLTNGLDPDPTVLALARDLEVPLVKVPTDTFAALEAISDLLLRARFRQRFKVEAAERTVAEHLDLAALQRALAAGAAAAPSQQATGAGREAAI